MKNIPYRLYRKWLSHNPAVWLALSQLGGTLKLLNISTARNNKRIRRIGAEDGFPIPPDDLIYLVAGTMDLPWFLRSGKAAADSMRSTLNALAMPWEALNDVLDWGCGCGRVLRHFYGATNPQLFGCDFNAEQINWMAGAFPNARFSVNGLSPPFPYPPEAFDLVYGLSVFTHLPEREQAAWMRELSRVLRPGGVALFSTCGSAYLPSLAPEERAQFNEGKLVVRDEVCAGWNLCMAFHPETYVRTEMAERHGFDVVVYEPVGAKGNPPQDLNILRKRHASEFQDALTPEQRQHVLRKVDRATTT